MKKSFTVRDLPPAERPRERLLQLGPEALSVPELLALILGRGIKGESVMITAQHLLSRYGDLRSMAESSVEELAQVRGIGPAKASQIVASFELARRLEACPENGGVIVKSPENVLQAVRSRLKGKKREHFLTVLLDSRNRVMGVAPVSVGSLDSSLAHPREVFKEAVSASAASVIFVHNHPSGDPQPSEDDIKLTKRLVEAGAIVGIEVLDHVIVADRAFASLKAMKLI